MSQDPLARLRRRERREPRTRNEFPDTRYRSSILDPIAEEVERTLGRAAEDVYRAHAVVLAERRIVEPNVASDILRGLSGPRNDRIVDPVHVLSSVETDAVRRAGPSLLLATAREEVLATAMRIVLRERVLDVHSAVLRLRETLAAVALQHLTTLLLATSNGQVVQPTSLGHYLAGQIGPLLRTTIRLQEVYPRLNQSPLGAVSGMATAMPIHRERPAALLGFDGPVESTFDAIASADVFLEIANIVSMMAIELTRLLADLLFWARDDVGTMAPSDTYVHGNDAQPQRRDPVVLDHIRTQLLEVAGVPQRLMMQLSGRQMLGGERSNYSVFSLVETQLTSAVETIEILSDVVSTADVNRALFAHRANRGFATSSELADLLSIDFKIPRNEAIELAQRVVVEATEAGGEATTLRTEVIDGIALKLRGVEVGIEPEMLAKVLSPKRFVERRDHPGGPAPSSVRTALERETFAANRDTSWSSERRTALSTAAEALTARADAIASDPDAALRRT